MAGGSEMVLSARDMLRLCLGIIAVPTLCLVLAIVGLKDAEPEGDVYEIWAPQAGSYWEDTEYLTQIEEQADPPLASEDSIANSSYSQGVMISLPRAGGNHMTSASLLELIERQRQVENITVQKNGDTFTYKDLCYGTIPSDPEERPLGYTFPCYKLTPVHAYTEGGYDFDEVANTFWYDALLLRGVIRPFLSPILLSLNFPPVLDDDQVAQFRSVFGIAESPIPDLSGGKCVPRQYATHPAFQGLVAQNPVLQGAVCIYECFIPCAAALQEAQAGGSFNPAALTSDTLCRACMTPAEQALYAAMEQPQVAHALGYTGDNVSAKEEWLYYSSVKALLQAQGQSTDGLTNEQLNAAVDHILASQFGIARGTSNLFNFNVPALGYVKGTYTLSSPATTTEDILRWASGGIFGWGGADGQYPYELLLGGPVPDHADISLRNPLQSVEALMTVYLLHRPENLVKKLEHPLRPGGPVTIDMDTATDVLSEFKEQMDIVWGKNWDDESSSDVNYYYPFQLAGGSVGTFGRKLVEFTDSATGPAIGSYVAVIVMSILLLSSCPLTESKMLVGMVGAMFSVLAFLGALGCIVLSGYKLQLTSVWTMPFLMVGLGVDDMYVILISLIQDGGETRDGLWEAYKRTLVPVTMTSMVNAGMFAMLTLATVPAAFVTGRLALYAILLQYLIMVTAFPCVCFLDMLRQKSSRTDCLCCVKGGRGKPFKNLAYQQCVRGFITRPVGHIIVLIVAVAAIVVAAIGAKEVEVGLDIDQFFEPDTLEQAYFGARQKYFSTWPCSMTFGELDYTNAEVQLQMLEIFEKTVALKWVTDLSATTLWSASFAVWGTGNCFSVGMAGRCGLDFGCEATWVENARNLNLNTHSVSPGVCRRGVHIVPLPAEVAAGIVYDADKEYCPVFTGMSQDKLSQCLRDWQTWGGGSSPGYAVAADGVSPQLPIRSTETDGANFMSNIGLATIDDYIAAIEDTRQFCDDNEEIHCFMVGTAYDFWEQYIGLWDFAGTITGLAAFMGFLVAFVFLLVSFIFDATLSGSHASKICSAMTGAWLIILCMALSVFTVFGIASLAGVRFSVLTVMTYLIAIGFSVEYAVHIVHRFLTAPKTRASGAERVDFALELLTFPMGSAFLASMVGIMVMLTTPITLVRKYFFVPLLTVQLATYFYGAFFLPTILCYMPCACLNVGPEDEDKHAACALPDVEAKN